MRGAPALLAVVLACACAPVAVAAGPGADRHPGVAAVGARSFFVRGGAWVAGSPEWVPAPSLEQRESARLWLLPYLDLVAPPPVAPAARWAAIAARRGELARRDASWEEVRAMRVVAAGEGAPDPAAVLRRLGAEDPSHALLAFDPGAAPAPAVVVFELSPRGVDRLRRDVDATLAAIRSRLLVAPGRRAAR